MSYFTQYFGSLLPFELPLAIAEIIAFLIVFLHSVQFKTLHLDLSSTSYLPVSSSSSNADREAWLLIRKLRILDNFTKFSCFCGLSCAICATILLKPSSVTSALQDDVFWVHLLVVMSWVTNYIRIDRFQMRSRNTATDFIFIIV